MYGGLSDQKKRKHTFIETQAIKDDAVWPSNVLDVTGLDTVTVCIGIGATDIAMANLRIQTSETISGPTALSGTITDLVQFGTYPGTRLPTADDDKSWIEVVIPVSGSNGLKRYINIAAMAGNGSTGTFLTAHAECTPRISPNTAAEMGLAQLVVLPG